MEGNGYKKVFPSDEGTTSANQESRESSPMWLMHCLRRGTGDQSGEQVGFSSCKPCIGPCIQPLTPITPFMVHKCLKLQVIISSNPKPCLYHLFPILFNGTTINPDKQSYLQRPEKEVKQRGTGIRHWKPGGMPLKW